MNLLYLFRMPQKTLKCCWCLKRTSVGSGFRRHVTCKGLKKETEKLLGRTICSDDIICARCRRRFYRNKKKIKHVNQIKDNNCGDKEYSPPFVETPTSTSSIRSPQAIQLQILSTPRGHKKCVVCRKPDSHRNHLTVVPHQAITQAFVETGIFINEESRCCKFHLDGDYFIGDTVKSLAGTKDAELFSRTDICRLLQKVRSVVKSVSYLNFDVPTLLSDDDYFNLTGLKRDQFSVLAAYIHSMRNITARSTRTCLAVFLTKLRTGLPNTILSSIFHLTVSQVQRIIPSVRDALMQDFVPPHLGFGHIDHLTFCRDHTTPVAKTLFTSGDSAQEAVLVLDGTYIYIQKSADYEFQRRSYGLHKNRPLVKPMMVVGTDGYILSVLGPYLSDYDNNDASITKHMISKNVEDIKGWLEADDVFIVDRGFRDAVDFLTDQGIKVEMPYYLKKKKKGQKQHTTLDANLSRLVTKVIWVVESANGRIKQWRFLDRVVPNSMVGSIGDFVRIICAICNKFRPPLASMDPTSVQIAEKMLKKSNAENEVQQIVQDNNLLKRRAIYSSIDSNDEYLEKFPVLSMEELQELTMGIYQIKQARSYTNEHIKDDGSYELMVCNEFPNLLRVKIQSRHSKSTIHTLWIKYSDTDISNAIKGWYCTCKVGARDVGCCAHVSSVLWFHGLKRHQCKQSESQSCLSHFENAHI